MIFDIVAIQSLADGNVRAISSRKTGQGALLKFAAATRAIIIIGHFIPEPCRSYDSGGS